MLWPEVAWELTESPAQSCNWTTWVDAFERTCTAAPSGNPYGLLAVLRGHPRLAHVSLSGLAFEGQAWPC